MLAKEKKRKSIFNTNSGLSQSHAEKQIMPFKTTLHWLFDDIWRCIGIGCLNWKIGVFQQTVVRVFNILNPDPNKQAQEIHFSEKSNNTSSLHVTFTNTKVATCSAQSI